MPITQKLRKWHFLLLGSTLVLLSGYLWYWNWRVQGLPSSLRPEHYLIIVCFVVGIFVLGAFVYRLTRQQVTIMLLYMILVNLVAALVTLWIYRSYPDIFNILCPQEFNNFDAAYLAEWREVFLAPALYLLHGGLLLVWVASLVMFLVRKPGDQPG